MSRPDICSGHMSMGTEVMWRQQCFSASGGGQGEMGAALWGVGAAASFQENSGKKIWPQVSLWVYLKQDSYKYPFISYLRSLRYQEVYGPNVWVADTGSLYSWGGQDSAVTVPILLFLLCPGEKAGTRTALEGDSIERLQVLLSWGVMEYIGFYLPYAIKHFKINL